MTKLPMAWQEAARARVAAARARARAARAKAVLHAAEMTLDAAQAAVDVARQTSAEADLDAVSARAHATGFPTPPPAVALRPPMARARKVVATTKLEPRPDSEAPGRSGV